MGSNVEPDRQKRRYRKPGTLPGGYTPPTLAIFAELPNEARVRAPVVEALFSWSGPTLRRRIKAGTFPAPQRDGGFNVWPAGVVRDYLLKEAA